MLLSTTSLSCTNLGRKSIAQTAASSSSASNTLPDIDTYSHVRHSTINTANYNCMHATLSPDGTKLYTLHRRTSSTYLFYEQNLSTAFDISSYGSTTVGFNMRNDGGGPSFYYPNCFRFVDNGSKLYACNYEGKVKQYNLSTPWDTSTRTRISTVDITTGSTSGIFWKPDGNTLFYVDSGNDRVYAKHVSTPWDLTTITSTDQSFLLDITTTINEASPFDLYFSNDGLKLYIMGADNDYVYQYNLSTAWDITTSSFSYGPADKSLYVGNVETSGVGLHFSPDGTHMYIAGQTGNGVDQFVSS
tara:strand:- start:186 stop:1091 length:906 start_codon:yes stop_codon:yes gene_type:complete